MNHADALGVQENRVMRTCLNARDKKLFPYPIMEPRPLDCSTQESSSPLLSSSIRKAEGRRQRAQGKTISGSLNLPLIEDHLFKDLVGAWTGIGQGRAFGQFQNSFSSLFLLPSAIKPLPCPKGCTTEMWR